MVTKQAGDRGVSTVLGVILVIGMVIAASIVVLSVGAITLGDAQSAITTESAVTQMEELNSKILEAVEEPGGKVSMAVATPGSGSLEIETSGWVNLTVENSTGANVTTGAMTLGRVTYTVNDQEIVIQSGGVWRSNTGSDGAALVSRPTIGYNFDRKNPTLDLSVVDISGIEREGDRISFERNGKPTEKLRSINPIEPGSHLHITVKSELYRTWGDYFENRLEGKVNYDHEDNTVTAKVPAMPEPVTLDSGVVAAGNLSI